MPTIRLCTTSELAAICAVVNDAAQAYRGVIAADRWKAPYMPIEELREESAAGVMFSGCETDGQLVAVMGLQHVQDVSLIRHAYTRAAYQGKGYGVALLEHPSAPRPAARCWWARGRPRRGPCRSTSGGGSNL
jgi:GNAT superfamily N-acetyltransferase